MCVSEAERGRVSNRAVCVMYERIQQTGKRQRSLKVEAWIKAHSNDPVILLHTTLIDFETRQIYYYKCLEILMVCLITFLYDTCMIGFSRWLIQTLRISWFSLFLSGFNLLWFITRSEWRGFINLLTKKVASSLSLWMLHIIAVNLNFSVTLWLPHNSLICNPFRDRQSMKLLFIQGSVCNKSITHVKAFWLNNCRLFQALKKNRHAHVMDTWGGG